MARWSKTLTPEAMAAFLLALRGGALVEAAARGVGVAVSTLYWRRKSDPVFALAWDAAASLSAAAPGRRLRFGATRRRFLGAFARSCNLRAAGAETRVHRATVYRHIGRDAGFERDCRTALARGYEGLEREIAAERAAAARRWARHEIVPIGRPSGDFEEIMKLLARYGRPDGSIGPRFVRHGRLKRWRFDDAIALLAKKLKGMEPGWGRRGEKRPLHHLSGGPPPLQKQGRN